MHSLLLLLLFTPLFSIGQFTAIPDLVFEQALIDLGHDTGTPDGQVLTANISGVDSLDVQLLGISDLTGIEAFNALIYLDCSYNQITSIDVSNNTALEYMRIHYNQLTNLDVSNNSALTKFMCFDNQLNSLNVSSNAALTYLDCAYNQIISIDVSNNTTLTRLDCAHNQLTCLNVNNGINTNMLFMRAGSNPNLTCIEVDDVAWSTTNWTVTNNSIASWMNFSSDCNNPCSSTWISIEAYSNQPRSLIRILDLLGRETNFKPNTPLIYQYDDGSVEKTYTIE
jgi:hypothetical protein